MTTRRLALLILVLVVGCSRQAAELEVPPARSSEVPPPAVPKEHTRPGHKAHAICVAFSPDNKRLASGSADRTVKIWDVITGDLLLTLPGNDDYINWVAFSPDGNQIAAVSERFGEPGKVRIWDATTGKERWSLHGQRGQLSRCIFSPDGGRLAAASADRSVRIWDLASGKELRTLRDHAGPVNSIAFRPDGRRLAAASYAAVVLGKATGEVKLWDPDTGQEQLTISVPGAAMSVAFSPDGQRLAVAGSDTPHVWDANTGKDLLALKGIGFVDFLTWRPDGQQLAGIVQVWSPTARQPTRAIRLWDATTGQEQRTVSAAAGVVAYSPDYRLLASAGTDVQIWDVSSDKPILTLTGPQPQDSTGAIQLFSPDGTRLASMTRVPRTPGGELQVRDVASGRELFTAKHDKAWIVHATFSSDGNSLATAGGNGQRGDLKLWDIATGKEQRSFPSESGDMRFAMFSPEGRQILGVSVEGGEVVATIWDIASGKELHTLRRQEIGTLLYHADGRLLDWTRAQIREALTGNVLFTIRAQTPFGFTSVLFSRDGSRLATAEGPTPPAAGGASGLGRAEVRLWDATKGRELLTLTGHPHSIRCLAFSPDGSRLATGSEDRNVKVWDTATGKEIVTYRGHTLFVLHLHFSADGNRVASVSADGTLKTWDAATGLDVPPSE